MMKNLLHKYLGLSFTLLLIMGLSHSCEWEQLDQPDLGALPDQVSFSEHIIVVFDNNCVRCHKISGDSPYLTAEDAYFNLSSGNFLNTDAPEESKLYEKISGSGSMSSYVDEYERALILKWIEQGAEDN